MAKKAETKPEDGAKAESGAKRVLRIAAKHPNGFWRCGVKHSAAPVDHPMDRFSPEDIERLKAEPALDVREIDMPAAEAKTDAAP